MPRDYANRKSSHEKKGRIPGWAWMLGGLTIGLFVAMLVYIKENTPQDKQVMLTNAVKRSIKETRKGTDQKRQGKTATTTEKSTAAQKRPRFDFYTILPELEVAIPEQELATKKSPSNTRTDKDSAAKRIQEDFTLQVGSFRKITEADKLKARLALQGVLADIQSVTINNGDTWHRVRVGPFHNVEQVKQIRNRLHKIGISSMVVKNKS